MAYNKRTWLGRQGTGLNKFSIGGATPVTIVNQPDSVTQVGDALSAGNLNDLEDRIEDAFDDVDTALDTKADEQDVTNLNDALSATNKRVENLEEAHGSYHEVDVKSVYTIPTGKGSNWLIDGLRGVSRAKNNLVQNGDFASTSGWTAYNCTISATNNELTITGTGTGPEVSRAISDVGGHTVLVYFTVTQFSANNRVRVRDPFAEGSYRLLSNGLYCAMGVANENTVRVKLQFYDMAVNDVVKIKNLVLTDLTVYFNGTIPSDADTIATIQTNYPWLLTPSDYGTSGVNTVYEGVVSIGVNIWDEVLEIGALNASGEVVSSATTRVTTSFIPILPDTAYFQLGPSSAYNGRVAFYDQNKNFVYYDNNGFPQTGIYTSPQGAYYMRVTLGASYPTTYGHDIQFCLYSLPSEIRTTYHPYFKRTLLLSTPVSLKSAGAVADTCELNVEVEVDGQVVNKMRTTTKTATICLNDISWTYLPSYGIYQGTLSDALFTNGGNWGISNTPYENAGFVGSTELLQGQYEVRSNGTIWIKDSNFENVKANYYLNYALLSPTVTLSDPILDNLIATEAGGTIESILTTPVDDSMTLGYINL